MVNTDQHRGDAPGAAGLSALPKVRQGFTIVEVIFAIVILAFGLLGTAGTTLWYVRQTTLADVTADRSAALQSTIERIRSLPFDSVREGTDSVGDFAIKWTVTAPQARWKSVEIVTYGPGLLSTRGFPTLAPSVPDSFTYRIIE
jgi:prepilin-type N-terminal cleavage/methylation domain-containing protein